MEKEKGEEKQKQKQKLGEGPQVSKMEAVTHGAYGGGMYGTEEEEEKQAKAPASESQSADGPLDNNNNKDAIKFKHHPPSSGDRDIDITGQSYIQ